MTDWNSEQGQGERAQRGWENNAETIEVARQEAIAGVVDYLRHVASGYALMRSIKANGARDALYGVADKLEKDWKAALGSRVAPLHKGEDR